MRIKNHLIVSLLLFLILLNNCFAESDSYSVDMQDDGTLWVTDIDVADSTVQLDIPSEFDGCTVTGIGKGAIRFGRNLSRISFPDTITSIPECPIDGIARDSIIRILVSSNHPYLAVIDDSLFSKPDKRILFHTNPDDGKSFGQNKKITYTVPEGIEIIGAGAFEYDGIVGAILPDTVLHISDKAFHHCLNLKTVNLSNSLLTIGDEAFRGCGDLADIKLPNGIKSIGFGAFLDCKNLSELILPDSLEHLGIYIAHGTDVDTICIPQNVTQIEGPLGIINISISPKNVDYTIKDDFLVGNVDSKLIQPIDYKTEYTIPDGVTTIGNRAFCDCNPSSIVLPDTVETIEEFAFSCESLKSINLPVSVTEIATNAFNKVNKEWFQMVVVPDSYAERFAKEHEYYYTYSTETNNEWLK